MRIVEASLEVTRINQDWATYPHTTDSGIVRTLLEKHRGAHDEGHAERVLQTYKTACRALGRTIDPIPGAGAALAALESREGWMVGFASGNWNAIGRIKLRAAGLDPGDHVFVGACDDESREGIMQRAVAERRERHGRSRSRSSAQSHHSSIARRMATHTIVNERNQTCRGTRLAALKADAWPAKTASMIAERMTLTSPSSATSNQIAMSARTAPITEDQMPTGAWSRARPAQGPPRTPTR